MQNFSKSLYKHFSLSMTMSKGNTPKQHPVTCQAEHPKIAPCPMEHPKAAVPCPIEHLKAVLPCLMERPTAAVSCPMNTLQQQYPVQWNTLQQQYPDFRKTINKTLCPLFSRDQISYTSCRHAIYLMYATNFVVKTGMSIYCHRNSLIFTQNWLQKSN